MEEFLTSDMYFGREAQRMMRPAIKGLLIESFDGDPAHPCTEIILSGSIGWGKSYAAAVALLYVIYRLTCLREPHAFYDLAGGSRIYIAIYSVSREQAEDSAYEKIRTWIDNMPYFREQCPRDRSIKARIEFTRSPVTVVTGSRELHTLGRDVFAFFLDEANFLDVAGQTIDAQQLAYRMYESAKNRLTSRFMRKSGEIAGLMLIASSKRARASFVEQHIKKSRARIFSGQTRVYQFAQWEVKPASDFTAPKFRVEVGSLFQSSRILGPEDLPRPGAQIVTVPGEYRERFETDIDQALRDIAGVATESIVPLITDRDSILRCIDPKLSHPFSRETLTLSTGNDIGMEAYFLTDVMFRVVRSRYSVRLNPECPRVVAFDVAFTMDSFGCACAHMHGFRRVRRTRDDGTWYEDLAPSIVFDFLISVHPPGGESEIDLSKMRAFVINLRDLGLPIWRVVCDGYQSRDNAQILNKVGFDAVINSVDRTDEPYLTLKQAVAEERARYYRYPILIRELGELERDLDHSKVDHPDVSPTTGLRGSKDVADAACNCVWGLLSDKRLQVPVSSPDESDNLDNAVRVRGGDIPWPELDRERRR
jgi:hypothetical protein